MYLQLTGLGDEVKAPAARLSGLYIIDHDFPGISVIRFDWPTTTTAGKPGSFIAAINKPEKGISVIRGASGIGH